MKKFATMIAALFVCLSMMAQWTKPAAPAQQTFAAGEQAYLYNADAEAFWLGANDWQTRASVNATRGYKVSFDKYLLEDGSWDGKSYRIMTAIEEGEPAGEIWPTFLDGLNSIWVDARRGNADKDQGWTLNQLADGTYHIGLSPLNKEFNPAEGLDNAWLGLVPEYKDTRLYICEEGTGAYEFANCQIRWYFVAEADYKAYVSSVLQYNAALQLGNDIAKAKADHPKADISSVEAIYNNHASTAEELTAARATLVKILMAIASPAEPVDVTEHYVVNPSYDNNDNTGWEGDAPAFQSHGNAEFYWKNYDYSQTVNVPKGVYRVSVNAFYRAGWCAQDGEALDKRVDRTDVRTEGQNALLFAGAHSVVLPFASEGATEEQIHPETLENEHGWIPNAMSSAAAYMAAGRYPATTVVGATDDAGQLTFGVKKTITLGGDWTILDDWHLEYVGNDAEAYNYLKADYLAYENNYVYLIESGEIEYYNHAAYEAYKAAREELENASTAEAIVACINKMPALIDALDASIKAYAAYYAKYVEAQEFLDVNGESMMGEGMDILADYMFAEDEPTEQFPNGTAAYILTEGLLSAEQLAAEISFIQKLIDDAMATGMTDGTDCTELVKNAHFAEPGVWNKEGFPEWPLGSGGYKVAQAWSILFNVNQQLTGLQNGLYELTLKDFFRPANYGTDDYGKDTRAYVYMNSDEAQLNHIESDAIEEEADGHISVGEGKFVPNDVDAAARAFEAGRYQQTLFGLVTDGTLKIGVRNDLRYEGCWAVWSDIRLTFRAKNPEVLASVLNASVPNAEALLLSKCGSEEIATLSAAIDVAKAEPEDGYQALVDLENAIAAVKVCTETYSQLNVTIADAAETLKSHAADTGAAIDELKKLYDEVSAAYDAGAYNNQTAAEMDKALGAAVTAVKMGTGNSGAEQDVTDLIVNNNFDPSRGEKGKEIEGWVTSPTNGYKEYTCSYNRAAIDLSQTLKGLPAGHYRVTVHTYYRAGYWNEEEERVNKGEETHLTTLYAATPAKTFETKVMNLYEGAVDQLWDGFSGNTYTLGNGKLAPDGTSPTAAFFAAGHYLNELQFDVDEDGSDVTIGLKKTETLPNDYQVVGAWHLYYTPAGETPEAQDVTDLIVNNNFDPSRGEKGKEIEGWVTSPTNGYKEYTCSYNRAAIDLHQTIKGLPAGDYKVTVHTYYRAGYWNEEEERVTKGEETHLTTLYAETPQQTFETKVMNLYEGAVDQLWEGFSGNTYTLGNGKFAPDGTSPTAAFFAAGHYLNELDFTVQNAGSDVTIGLRKTEILANDYEVVGAWHLYYYGVGSSIDNVIGETTANASAGFYNLNGIRLATPQRGINIIRQADGTTRKVFVK